MITTKNFQNQMCAGLTRKLWILCLPGFYNNIEVMTHQLRYYEYLFGSIAEFDIVNPPHECQYVFDSSVKWMFKGPFYSWYFVNEETKECWGMKWSIDFLIEYAN